MKVLVGQIKNEIGSVMNVALLILLLLTSIVIYGVMASRTDVKIVANDKLAKTAFYAAESGQERGRIALNDLKEDSGNLDTLLRNSMSSLSLPMTGQLPADTSLNDVVATKFAPNGLLVAQKAGFNLFIRDNDDSDASDVVDTDGIVLLSSVGSYGNAERTVVAEVKCDIKGYLGKNGNSESNNNYGNEYKN